MRDWRAFVRENLPPIQAGPARENEIVAELALQLEQAYAGARSGGASPSDALRLAQSQLGDWQALSDAINAAECPALPRRAVRGEIASGTLADLRYAARSGRRNPVFAAIAVGTLAFGIGANTAIFTLLDALLLRSLPYREPERIMAIDTRKANQPEVESWTSLTNVEDFRNQARSFSEVAAVSPVWNLVMTGRGQAERLEALFVSDELFPLLGVSPAIGRRVLPDDARMQAVLLSHAFWQRRFGGSSEVLGKTVTLDGVARTIVGILPAGFRYAGEPLAGTVSDIDVWLPLSVNPLATSNRSVRFLKVIGRLKPGVTVERARQEVRRIGEQFAEQHPETDRGLFLDGQPLRTQVTGRMRATVLLLLGAVGFVLMMACANVANLVLARAAARRRELAVRAALGASRWRILRQLLAEGMVLAIAGGVAGLLVAYGGLRLLLAVAPATMVNGRTIALDARALFFTIAAVVACTLLAGLAPAWRIARADLESVLREAGRGLTAGHHRLRSLLVVVQISVALLLLVGSALLIRSFQRLLDVNPGFQARNLVTLTTQVGHSAQTPQERAAAYERMRDQLLSVPGVRSVAAVSRLPLQGRNVTSWLSVEGRSTSDGPPDEVEYRVATSTYFETMSIPLRAGRLFTDQDNPQAAGIVLINETAARRFWPGADPVGSRVKFGLQSGATPWITVIGVVGDIRHVGLDIEPLAEIYRPYAVNPLGNPVLVIRTEADAAPMVNLLAMKARLVSPDMPVYNVYRMQTLVDRSAAQRRFAMWLLTAFAASAVLLAGVGVYGTVSQAVVQRTREIGVRMALGASPGAVLRLVFGDGLRLAGAGIAIGTVAAVGLTRLIVNLLFEVRPLDPVAFAAGAAVLAGFAALACYIPARRATRVDPLTTLREDS